MIKVISLKVYRGIVDDQSKIRYLCIYISEHWIVWLFLKGLVKRLRLRTKGYKYISYGYVNDHSSSGKGIMRNLDNDKWNWRSSGH
jgi:hypothetical protein